MDFSLVKTQAILFGQDSAPLTLSKKSGITPFKLQGFRFLWTLFSKEIVGIVPDTPLMEISSGDGSSYCKTPDASIYSVVDTMELEWVDSSLRMCEKSIIPLSTSVFEYVRSLEDLESTSMIAYSFNKQYHFLIIVNSKIAHYLSFPKEKTSLSSCVSRVEQWWLSSQDEAFEFPVIAVGSGVGSAHYAMSQDVSIEEIACRGGVIASKEDKVKAYYTSNPFNALLQRWRLPLVVMLTVFLIALIIFSTLLYQEKQSLSKMSQEQSLELAYPVEELERIEEKLATSETLLARQLNEPLEIEGLNLFGANVGTAIKLQRISCSRETGATRAWVIDGTGKSEPAVSAFISSVEKSAQVRSVVLDRIDRLDNSSYRFRVTCITQK